MNKRLFVVLNPTQYLNAVEYVYATGKQEDHILIMTKFMKGIRELDKLGARETWASVSELNFDEMTFSNDGEFWKACKDYAYKVFNLIGPQQLILGNLIDNLIYPFVLSVNSRVERITALDDGTPTLDLANNRYLRKFYSAYHLKSFRTLVKNLLFLRSFHPLHFSTQEIRVFFNL